MEISRVEVLASREDLENAVQMYVYSKSDEKLAGHTDTLRAVNWKITVEKRRLQTGIDQIPLKFI